VGIAIIEAEDSEDPGAVDDENLLELVNIKGKETYQDVQICPDLTNDQKRQVRSLLEEYQEIFTDAPGNYSLRRTQDRVDHYRPDQSQAISCSICQTERRVGGDPEDVGCWSDRIFQLAIYRTCCHCQVEGRYQQVLHLLPVAELGDEVRHGVYEQSRGYTDRPGR
jgi:hypothetical protein